MLGKNVVHSKNIPYESESALGSTGESFGNAAVVDPYVGATEEDAVLIIVDEPVDIKIPRSAASTCLAITPFWACMAADLPELVLLPTPVPQPEFEEYC